MEGIQLDGQSHEIEQVLCCAVAPSTRRFETLDRTDSRHDALVALLLAASAPFLAIGLATMSLSAWLVGVSACIAALSIEGRRERHLREQALRERSDWAPR
jgi:hypothetical protein